MNLVTLIRKGSNFGLSDLLCLHNDTRFSPMSDSIPDTPEVVHDFTALIDFQTMIARSPRGCSHSSRRHGIAFLN